MGIWVRRYDLKENGKGPFLLDVNFLAGERATISVDSGAEDDACLEEWGEKFGMYQGGQKFSFRKAGGGPIEHYGERDFTVTYSV
eukprot:1501017-Karenia_brevis.AAC.1